MTIAGNDPAQPNPDDPTLTAPPAAQAETPAAPAPEPASDDPDVIEWNAAKAAAQAEEAAPPAATPPADATGTEPPAATAPAPTDQPAQAGQPQPQQPQAPGPMIPKARLDEVLSEKDKALQDAAYWRGRAEAIAPQPGQPGVGQPPAQPVQTPEQKLATIHTALDALAQKFDDGQITALEWRKQERELQAQERTLLAAPASAPAPQQGDGDALYLNTLTAELEAAHPWTNVFQQVGTDADWDYLKRTAIENLVARGVNPSAGTVGTFELRKEIAALADEYGPALLTKRATAKGIALPGQQTPAPQPAQGQQQLSPTAQSRVAKLALQGNAPPDLASLTGAQGPNAGTVTLSNIDAMSDDEIAALPAATRQKLLGVTA